MSASAVVQAPPKGLAKIPGRAWGMLFLTLFVTISVPLNMFKCPGIAGQLMEYFGLDSSTFGWTMSLYTVMAIVLAFPASGIMGKIGEKNCIAASLVFAVVGAVMGALSQTATLFMVSRFIEGFAMGLVAVAAPAAISKWFPRHKRGTALGIWTPWVPIGNIIMLNLSNPISNAFGGWQAVWWVGAAYALIALVAWVALYKGPEMPILDDDEIAEAAVAKGDTAPDAGKLAILNPTMWLVAIAFCAFNIIQNGSLNTFYPTYLTEIHSFGAAEASFVTSVVTILGILGGPLGGLLSDKFRTRRWVILVSFVAIAVACIWLFSWGSTWQLWLAIAICGLLGGALPSNIYASVAEIMGPKDTPVGQAIATFMQNIGNFVGGIALGYIQVSLGWAMGSYVLFFPLLVIAIACVLFCRKLR